MRVKIRTYSGAEEWVKLSAPMTRQQLVKWAAVVGWFVVEVW